MDLNKESVKTFVTQLQPKKEAVITTEAATITDEKIKKKPLSQDELRAVLEGMDPSLLKPEMVTLKRRKKKDNEEDPNEYEDIPEDEETIVPTLL